MSRTSLSSAETAKDGLARDVLRPRQEGVELRRREAVPRPAPRPVPFLAAAHRDCRWPLWEGEEEPKLVCGAPRIPDASYCREHWRLSRRR